MAEPYPALTPAQSAARVRELQAQGYEVSTQTLPDGTVVVSKRDPATNWAWVALLGLGLFTCWASAKARRG